ncbi:MAG TPA: NAD(P)-binding domain-containing protein [Acetobacteraceae bacterium]|nr:NAD(P)-binding domain-containing protein [Acetobacteraceae bacterium]
MNHLPMDPNAAARDALRLIGPDPANWVPDKPGIDHNVTVVGGGQTGSAFAFALRRAGIGKVTVIDAAEDEARAGVWLNAARMNLLRTPKSLPGPELGIPAFGFQSWYEARHGAEAYAAIDRIVRTDWADYLTWYRRFLGIAIRYRTKLLRIEPGDGHFRLHMDADGHARIETTRKIILCTGFTGNGGPYVPSELSEGLPTTLYAHTETAIDFAALHGRRVAVIGAAASAFDAAGVALEAGAASVHLFARRTTIAAVPITRSRGYPGAYDNFYALPDAARWEQALRFRRWGSTPTTDAIERTVACPNFHLHLGAVVQSVRVEDGRIAVRAADEEFRCDFVIAGTGYYVDLAARPELADFHQEVLLWRDRFMPPAGDEDPYLGAHPYLGAGHEYLGKVPGDAPYLRDIHVQNPAGFVSFGLPIGDIPSMKRDIPTVVARISSDLFLADIQAHERRIVGDVAPDFNEEVYARAVHAR